MKSEMYLYVQNVCMKLNMTSCSLISPILICCHMFILLFSSCFSVIYFNSENSGSQHQSHIPGIHVQCFQNRQLVSSWETTFSVRVLWTVPFVYSLNSFQSFLKLSRSAPLFPTPFTEVLSYIWNQAWVSCHSLHSILGYPLFLIDFFSSSYFTCTELPSMCYI